MQKIQTIRHRTDNPLARLVVLIAFLAALTILSRTCVPWFLKLMISLSSQVNWSVSMISSLYVSLLSWDVCHPQRQVAYHKYVQAASIGQSYYKTLVSFHRPMSFINWRQLHFAFLLLGLVFLIFPFNCSSAPLSCLWLLNFFYLTSKLMDSIYFYMCSSVVTSLVSV